LDKLVSVRWHQEYIVGFEGKNANCISRRSYGADMMNDVIEVELAVRERGRDSSETPPTIEFSMINPLSHIASSTTFVNL